MRTLAPFLASLLLAACAVPSPVPVRPAAPAEPGVEYAPRHRPDVTGTRGAVVAGHPLAAAAGHEVLQRGGNAVDAAVTMAAVLAVVRPHMNGVGGDAFALFYEGETGKVTALNGSGRAGRLATPQLFATRGLQEVPATGALSVTVPGAVSAWAAALERYGTLSLAEALEPAIRYAEEGFPVTATLQRDLEGTVRRLNEPGREVFALDGGAPAAGALLRNPALGRTLRVLATEGPAALYGGSIGRALAGFVEAEGGYLRLDDFARHTADWTEPISIVHQGKRVFTFPPNTQGLALLQQLEMADHFPLGEMGHNSPEYLHTLVELKKLAFADRDRWVADPAFSPAPLERLLDPGYLRSRAGLVGDHASAEVAPGLGGPAADPAEGDGDTVYLMAVDRWGNAVSWIQSLFHGFGSGLVEPTTGIVLHNRGAGFTLDPAHPNVIAPGKRPFHTLHPALVTDGEGRLEMTLGTPGGHGQTQSLVQVLNNVYRFGMAPQEAVEAPRFRSEAGLRLLLESRIPPAVRRELARRGHEIRVVDGWTATFGGVQVIRVHPQSGVLRTGADPRREAYGIAY